MKAAAKYRITDRVRLHPALRFLLLSILLFTLLVLRRFFADDGQVFYVDQLTIGCPSIFVPYNGCLSLITRLVAGFEGLVPAAFAPLLCSLAGLAVQASSYAILVLEAFRYLIQSDLLRIAIALILTTSLDGAEMIGDSLNSQWHHILPGLLLLFLPNSGQRSRISDAFIAAATLLIALSASILVVVLPITLFRAALAFFLVLAALAWLFRRAAKPQRLALLLDFFQPTAVQLFTASRYFALSGYALLFVIAYRDHGLPNREVRAPIFPEPWVVALPALNRTR